MTLETFFEKFDLFAGPVLLLTEDSAARQRGVNLASSSDGEGEALQPSRG